MRSYPGSLSPGVVTSPEALVGLPAYQEGRRCLPTSHRGVGPLQEVCSTPTEKTIYTRVILLVHGRFPTIVELVVVNNKT